MTPVAIAITVREYAHMDDPEMTNAYLRAIGLVNVSDVARKTRRSRRALVAYQEGSRRVTEEAATELARYLREQSAEFAAAATALTAAVQKRRGGK